MIRPIRVRPSSFGMRVLGRQVRISSRNHRPLKTDWRDFVAITLAVYQILLGPLLLIVGGIVGVYLLFLWLAR